MIHRCIFWGLALAGLAGPACAYDAKTRVELESLIVKHAAANNVPPALVHRIIIRESRYNPRAVGRGGALGLMQIKHETARALGYKGPVSGLLDAETNLTYGVRYLAGAYRVAGGDQNRAVGYFARGYYYDAKRKGLLRALARTPTGRNEAEELAEPAPAAQPAPSLFALLFLTPAPSDQAQEARRAQEAVPTSDMETEGTMPAEAPLPPKRSVHLGRTTGSGADRAAQTASARQDDPGRRP